MTKHEAMIKYVEPKVKELIGKTIGIKRRNRYA